MSMASLPRDWQSPYRLADGIPLVPYPAGLHTNPTTAATYGLASWSLWTRYHDRPRLRAATRVAEWLLATQRRDGTWRYRFAYVNPGIAVNLGAGWTSAMAQGQAISLLGRIYRKTRHRRYLTAIRRALAPLTHSVTHGGLARHHGGGLWFEEYPTDPPSYVLNGFMFTLLGLADVHDLARLARRQFARGYRCLKASLPDYDNGDISFYSATARIDPPPSYQPLIRELLRDLDRFRPSRRVRFYAAKWSRVAIPGE
jgi:hypothetical protein